MIRRKSRFESGDASIILLIAIFLLLAGGIVISVFTFRSDPIDEVLSSNRVISVLYVIEKDMKPLSTYVLMCYPNTRRAAVFDIPGEIGMLIRRINRVDRIDTVYEPERITNFRKEIEMLLDVDIPFSIVINADNLGKAVDLIEGVELFIPSEVRASIDGSPVMFPSGINRLDGDKAVSFVSYRTPEEDNDMAVSRRQRFFLGFIKRQAEVQSALKDSSLSQLYMSFMQTSFNQRAGARLFDEMSRMDLERISVQSIGGVLREVSGQMLLIPFYDGSLAKDIVRQTLGMLTSTAEGIMTDRVFTVEVLNGTTVNGLAGRTADVLRGFGYDIISIGNADHAGYERTLVIDRSGMEGMARNFAGIIRCGNISFEALARDNSESEHTIQNYEYRSDFTLIIGRDFNGRYVTGN